MFLPRCVEGFSQFHESREAPVTLLRREAMRGMVNSVYGRILRIPQHQRKLYTCIPICRGSFIESVLEIERGAVDAIAVGKE